MVLFQQLTKNRERNCFDKVKEQLDLGIDSNFDEFHQSYLKLYPTSTEPIEEIKRKFWIITKSWGQIDF